MSALLIDEHPELLALLELVKRADLDVPQDIRDWAWDQCGVLL